VSPELWIALGGLVLHALGVTGGCIWQLGKAEGRIMTEIGRHRLEINAAIENERRDISETVAAVRQKINDVELEAFKTFVRRDSFHEFLRQISVRNDAFERDVKERLDRQEKKLDRLIERGTTDA